MKAVALPLINLQEPELTELNEDNFFSSKLPLKLSAVTPAIWSSNKLLPLGSRSIAMVPPDSTVRALAIVKVPAPELDPFLMPGLKKPPDSIVTEPVVLPTPEKLAPVLTVMAVAAKLPLSSRMPACNVVEPA